MKHAVGTNGNVYQYISVLNVLYCKFEIFVVMKLGIYCEVAMQKLYDWQK